MTIIFEKSVFEEIAYIQVGIGLSFAQKLVVKAGQNGVGIILTRIRKNGLHVIKMRERGIITLQISLK